MKMSTVVLSIAAALMVSSGCGDRRTSKRTLSGSAPPKTTTEAVITPEPTIETVLPKNPPLNGVAWVDGPTHKIKIKFKDGVEVGRWSFLKKKSQLTNLNSPTNGSSRTRLELSNTRNVSLSRSFLKHTRKSGLVKSISVERGLRKTVIATVVVRDLWNIQPYKDRMAGAIALGDIWAACIRPIPAEKAILKIVNLAGREVGGGYRQSGYPLFTVTVWQPNLRNGGMW